MQKLYETYENCSSMIGVCANENEVPLLPICHTTQKAQIEIAIDQNSNFKRARIIPKEEARTIIPCTENSGGRTSGEAPHPLCDKLQYIAADYKAYGGTKNHYFNSYQNLISNWCKSVYSHPKVEAVLKYIEKGNVIRDLVKHNILYIGRDGKLLSEWEKNTAKQAPEIFKVAASGNQSDAFVRWAVEIPGDSQSSVWTDFSIYDSWIKYYSSIKQNRSLCYVTGVEGQIADQHPAKLRNDGDKAKLISSNDSSGFTYRGRFTSDIQACGVGFEVTQKAHSALRWLISRQGYKRGEQAIIAWATNGKNIPDFLADPLTIIGMDTLESDNSTEEYAAQEIALKLKSKIAGYNADLGDITGVVVMGMESATPGRMSITFYRELTGSDFLIRLNHWHNSCCWIHNYRQIDMVDKDTGKKKKIHIPFIGAPSPTDIAESAYGKKIDDKLRKATIERLLPCILDGKQIPKDLVESAAQRACNRAGMDDWEWNKTLSIACALFKKYQEKEEYSMSLDENRSSRDYLYGRLLALADTLEEWALRDASENRQTNAARLMQRFADHPFSTWRTIELALTPYKARLGGKATNRLRMISEVMARFNPGDFTDDRKLSGEFLLGYHCQKEALRNKKEE